MKKFLLLYIGGSAPTSPDEGKKFMDAWMAWFGRVGDKIVDGGAPLGARKTIGGIGSTNASGYSIISAENIDEAVKLTDHHPHLMSGGTIEVCEAVPVGR